MKIENCVNSIKVENSFLATLPPLNEIDSQKYESLLDLMEQRLQYEQNYLQIQLPAALKEITLKCYETMGGCKQTASQCLVLETPSEESA